MASPPGVRTLSLSLRSARDTPGSNRGLPVQSTTGWIMSRYRSMRSPAISAWAGPELVGLQTLIRVMPRCACTHEGARRGHLAVEVAASHSFRGGSGVRGSKVMLRCGLARLLCSAYVCRTRCRWRLPKISTWSMHSRRTVPTHRSANASPSVPGGGCSRRGGSRYERPRRTFRRTWRLDPEQDVAVLQLLRDRQVPNLLSDPSESRARSSFRRCGLASWRPR
jgi:hypothetical protein